VAVLTRVRLVLPAMPGHAWPAAERVRGRLGSILGGMDREIRVSDAEREDVVGRLRRAVSEGRLSVTEFDERAAAAYQAKTRGELEPLTLDLPRNLW